MQDAQDTEAQITNMNNITIKSLFQTIYMFNKMSNSKISISSEHKIHIDKK